MPGLVHLAQPKICQYDKFFKTDHEVKAVKDHNFLEMDYVSVSDPKAWSPESPFLYTGEITLNDGKGNTDIFEDPECSNLCITKISYNLLAVRRTASGSRC